MSRHYSDPSRESDRHALPDVEVFYVEGDAFDPDHDDGTWMYDRALEWMEECEEEDTATAYSDMQSALAGWYWWYALPGCLPDSAPNGPFASENDALVDACEQDD